MSEILEVQSRLLKKGSVFSIFKKYIYIIYTGQVVIKKRKVKMANNERVSKRFFLTFFLCCVDESTFCFYLMNNKKKTNLIK